MLSKRVVVVLCCLVACLWICAPLALGQASDAGTVSGTVTDSSGAAVPGATVYLVDVSTGSSRPTTTGDAGAYVFPYVKPGTYNVKVSKQGFKTSSVVNQVVEVGRQLTVNVVLEIGSVSQTVEVTVSVGSELQTMDATVGASLSGETLINLPNTSRDASTLSVLQPGQNINGNVGGAATDQNSYQVDGGYATDDMSGDNNTYIASFSGDTGGGIGSYHSSGFNQAPSAVIPLPVASVEEFKVSTANQTADFNGGAGSQVQVVTKRGTNTLHGSVYDYYQDTTFGGANSWDNNDHPHPLAPKFQLVSSHFSRFGGGLGGKIPHSNFLGGDWFAFGLYEGFRFPQGSTFSRSMPTASLRAGLIKTTSEVLNLNPVATVDPATGTSYAANTATCIKAGGCAPIPNGTATPTPVPQGGLEPCGTTTTSGTFTNFTPGPCDPRNLGINPVVQTLWNKYLPLPNNCLVGDGLNYCGYTAPIQTPQTSNFGVLRLDHDFPRSWHFNGTYHYYKLTKTVSDQWDIGGFFPGDKQGQYAAIRSKPQNAWLYTAGLTKDIRPGLTNDFHFSYTRNWWAYGDPSGVPNVAGYPAALEVGGENSGSSTSSNPVFEPYNTNNQSVRTRYWNGHDYMYRDDLTWIKGSHLFQLGGMYLRNVDTHKRNDNGETINTYEQYLIGEGNTPLSAFVGGMDAYVPNGMSNSNKYGNLYSMVLGMVDSTQGLFSRGLGSATAGLPLNPITSCAIAGVAATAGCMSSPPVSATSIIPTYNVYWTDSWRVKPKFTLNYGLGYTIEMPPYETTGGEQTAMVDATGHMFNAMKFLNQEKQLALQGVADAPNFGFSTVRNIPDHSKYPYDPFYGGLSPRVGVAWNFMPNTVLRGGYARIFGRINGVNPLLVPLLTPGLLQPDTCFGPSFAVSGTGAPTCGGTTPATNFRVGVDGTNAPLPPPVQNLPQPWYPGVNQIATGSGETFDPNFKPNQSDEFTINIQHQFGPRILAEAGYIGRKISNEIQYYGLGVVPYMMTVGGQSFANAWKNVMVSTNFGTNIPATVAAQPFFEAALGGPKSGYCTGFANCTTAFVMNNAGNMNISDAYDAWGSVSNAGAWTFGRTLTSDPISGSPFGAGGQSPSLLTTVSNGYGNYNAGFLQLTFTNWHGLTMKSNFTWSKALGTGNVVQATSTYATVDPWNLHNNYGPQYYDEKYNFNLFFNYSPAYYSSQKGVIGHLLGGWSFSPLFVYGSGFPVESGTQTGDASFGESNPGALVGTYENLVFNTPFATSGSTHFNTKGSTCGIAGPGVNVLSNPDTGCPVGVAGVQGIFGDPIRNPILGLDGQIGSGGNFRGMPLWNLDLGVTKKIKMTERFSGSLYFDFTNVLNHMQPADPCFNSFDTDHWGVIGCGGGVQANTPRRLQLGLSIDF